LVIFNFMKHKRILFYFSSLFYLLFSACTEEVIQSENLNYNYFPLEVGNYIEYQLDSVVFDDFTMTDTQSSYLVRELVESTFLDASGKEVYRIERAYKVNALDSWGSAGYDIWFASQNGNTSERIEENQRYIKLSYPIQNNREWKGNIHINTNPLINDAFGTPIENPLHYLDDWNYVVEDLNESFSINGFSFDSTVTIIQNEYGIQTDTIGAREVYANNIGLVFKELWVLSTQCSDCDNTDIICKTECFNSTWLEKGEAGFVVIQEILTYGKL
jgi:hypothetical protein